jgi:rhodanese-related sulfurtransferase
MTEIEFIEPETARGWIDAGEAVVIDVREAHEFAMAHIEGAVSLPLSSFDPAALPPHEDKKLIVQYAIGVRCGVAAQHLAAAGHPGTIHRLAGGLQAWYEAGNPITR